MKAIELAPGESKTVELEIDRYWLKAVTEDGERVDPDGEIALYIGGHQPDAVSDKLTGYSCKKIAL